MKNAKDRANLERKIRSYIVRILNLSFLWEIAVEILNSEYTSLEFKRQVWARDKKKIRGH